MAFPNALFPLVFLNTLVSDEEYRLFHCIDIHLIKTLICGLHCSHFDAMNVVAFLLWLERSRICVNAVYKAGNLYWPDNMLLMLANQVAALLKWLKKTTVDWEMLPVISLIEGLFDREVGFVELYQRRLEIFEGMARIVEEMMHHRAFEQEFDSELELINNGVGFPQQVSNYGSVNQIGVGLIPHPQELQIVSANGEGFPIVHGHQQGQEMDGGRRLRNGPKLQSEIAVGPRAERKMRSYQGQEMGSTSGAGRQTKHPGRSPIPEHLLSVLLSGINVTEEDTNVHCDDRTVFLTFSKGYPVSEHELRDFFTRRFGNFIRAIIFQEVLSGVQPLFALMVARNTSVMPLICELNTKTKTKYIINGKHVWARKFLRKSLPSHSASY